MHANRAKNRQRAGRKRGGGGLCKGKVFVESMPGALASRVCKCGCQAFQCVCVYKREGGEEEGIAHPASLHSEVLVYSCFQAKAKR